MLKLAAAIYLGTGLVTILWFWWESRHAEFMDSDDERTVPPTKVPDYVPEEWDA